jgi:thiamine pyrophosphate-dependent acetolactate synthase large subunit-like protein
LKAINKKYDEINVFIIRHYQNSFFFPTNCPVKRYFCFGLVGFSFGCGLGVKVAHPDKTVVSLMGDGGFGMTISELSTAVQYGINTITIVMNNNSWGAEKAYQKDFFGKRYIGADIISPPFDKVAQLYGAIGFQVNKVSEVNEALKAALKCNKAAVINVNVDPKALYSFRRDSFKHRAK